VEAPVAAFGLGDRRAARDASLGELVALATKDVSLLVRQEIELAKAEVGRQVASAAVGVGLLGAAAGLALGALIAITIFFGELFAWAGLARFWAFLLTAGLLLVVAGLLVLLAVLRLRRLQPPRRTIASVREDVAVLRQSVGGGKGGAAGAPDASAPPIPADSEAPPIAPPRSSMPENGRRPIAFDERGAG
jgi:Putative Actinobacterial Holin-X, holin superfamily III